MKRTQRDSEDDDLQTRQRGDLPELDRRDVLAMILALFQLFAPLVLALIVVGAIVGIVLRLL